MLTEKQKEYQRRWRRKAIIRYKEIAIAILGGACRVCGYKENIVALQIDHIKPKLRAVKERGLYDGSSFSRMLATGKISPDGLQLLCANCHAIKTYNDRTTFKNYKH